ncbi:MAG: hypothetical protein ACE5GN_06580 [Waddliaceae bacterium]
MTSEKVKRAMIGDWGSRDTQFMKVNQRVRERLLGIVNGQGTHVTIPLQGSGTFVVEAMLNTFIPRNGKVLVLVNGEYGERMAKICRQMDRKVCISQTEENVPNSLEDLEKILEQDLQISHVAAVYCETTTGMRNPISDVWERFLKKIWLEF